MVFPKVKYRKNRLSKKEWQARKSQPPRSLRRYDPYQVRRVILETKPKFSAQIGHPCGQFSMTTSDYWSRMRGPSQGFNSALEPQQGIRFQHLTLGQSIDQTCLKSCSGEQFGDNELRLDWRTSSPILSLLIGPKSAGTPNQIPNQPPKRRSRTAEC